MSDSTGDAAPAQAWAHREGLVRMNPLQTASWTPDAVQARMQIAETFHRFAIGHDEARIDVLESCFIEDGVLAVSQGHAAAFSTHQGRKAIGAALAHIIGQQDDQRRHLISNIVVESLDQQSAHVIAYGLVSSAGSQYGLRLGASVIYVADLTFDDDGCWRFARFHIGMDSYAGPAPTTIESVTGQ